MLGQTRHERLLGILGEEGVLPVREIARRLGVSQATARRDLTEPGDFPGASGVLPNGSVLDGTHVEVPVKRVMIAAARQVVLLASAGKFPGDSGLARICGAPDTDVLITNDTSDRATLAEFREARTEVITV